MARIAFFTEALPPGGDTITRFSWALIRSLADQNHEIRVFSTYKPETPQPEFHPRIEVLRPFRRWGILEIPHIVPLLLQQRPEILHIVQPHREALEGWTNAMNFVPGLAQLVGKPAVVASFFDIDEKTLHRHRMLLAVANALIVSNERQAETVRAYFTRREPPPIEVVPLGFDPETPPSSEIIIEDERDGIASLRTHCEDIIAIPGPLDQHVDVRFTFDVIATALRRNPRAGVIITGGWGHVPISERRAAEDILYQSAVDNRVLLTGPLAQTDLHSLLRTCNCLLLAPVEETCLSFTEILRASQSEAMPLILSLEQARLDPIAWIDGENALIRTRDIHDLSTAVTELLEDSSLRTRLRQNITELSRIAVSDNPGNIVSRLYSRLL